MNDAEKLAEYEKLLAEKKRGEWIDEIWSLVLGVVALTAMGLAYGYFAHLAFELQMEAPNAFILATAIILVIIVFASATIHAFKIVVKRKAEK